MSTIAIAGADTGAGATNGSWGSGQAGDDYAVVWHGALWREAAPEPEEPTTPAESWRTTWRPVAQEQSQIQRLYAQIGSEWTERRVLLARSGLSNGRHTSALLSRLYARGLVERIAVRVQKKGRPSHLYRRVPHGA